MKLPVKVLVSCFLSACLEMYDFAVFGFYTKVIYDNYLSFLVEDFALIITYILFAVGFVFRPIGALIFGYIGDVYGRKNALVISVTFMGLASLCMAILPPYELIGIVSCVLIAMIRIVQGISVGGEYSGAIIYAVEHFDKKKSGFVGGVIICGSISGVFMATVVTNILQSSYLPEYSWRFAFLIGFMLSIIGYFVRMHLIETPEFIKVRKDKFPIIQGTLNYPRYCMIAILLAASTAMNFYLILVFLPNYVGKILNIDISYISIYTTLILIILSPLFSLFSDRFDRRKLLIISMLCISIYNFFGLQFLLPNLNIFNLVLFIVGNSIIFATQAAIANVYIVEIFPANCRFSCAAFWYSIGAGVFGGTAPLMLTIILNYNTSYNILLFAGYMIIFPFMSYFILKSKN